MPTIEQIRAARALLDWSQSDLAGHAGLSQTGIARIENGTNQPNSQTLTKIKNAFENAEIEFLGERGVQRKSNEIKILKGHGGFVKFIYDVYETVKDKGGEVCVSNVDERQFDKWMGEDVMVDYLAKMETVAKNGHISYKIMIKEGDQHKIAAYAKYKHMKAENFGSVPFYVYGDKMAILLFEDEVSIYLIENREIANAQRKQFNIVWNSSE